MSNVQVQVKLDIVKHEEGQMIAVSLSVDAPTLGSDQPVLNVRAQGVPASDEGASDIASMLRTAADAIDSYLGRDTETHSIVDGTGEEVARVQTHTPREGVFAPVPQARPRFNPKPRGA